MGLCSLALLACAPKLASEAPGASGVSVAAGAPAPAPDPNAAENDRIAEGLDAYLEAFGEHWGPAFRFNGFVLVTRGDDVVYGRGFGFAEQGAGAPPDIDTSFRTGSVTKQFTAAAILKLQEQGKLEVTDTVRAHLPAFPMPGAEVTIHQLLTHTSGVWSYTSDPEIMETRALPHSVEQMLELFWEKPLDFEPGAEFRYSNSGYIVLGAIVEAASGMSYGEYLDQELFVPAGMTRTAFGDHTGLSNRAGAYERTPSETIVDAGKIHMSVPFAAGGVRSTARDLWTWHQALEGTSILTESSKAMLYTTEKNDYAYGWVVKPYGGHNVITHSGGIDGFVTEYRRLVDDDIVIVAWSNTGSPAGDAGRAAMRLAVGEKAPPVEEFEPVPMEPGLGAKVAGRYLLGDEGRAKLKAMGLPDAAISSFERIAVEQREGVLSIDPVGQPKSVVHSKGDGTFFAKGDNMPGVQFDLPPVGSKAGGLWVLQGPLKIYFEREP
ncbi:MAG: serine hydrolase domain-containing protein [Nannocystales bacterium]